MSNSQATGSGSSRKNQKCGPDFEANLLRFEETYRALHSSPDAEARRLKKEKEKGKGPRQTARKITYPVSVASYKKLCRAFNFSTDDMEVMEVTNQHDEEEKAKSKLK